MSNYYLGKGKVFTGTGNKQRWLGNVSELTLSLETERAEINESFSGKNNLAASVIISSSGSVSFTFNETTLENLALGLFGKKINIAAGQVIGEVIGDVVAGDYVALEKVKVSNVVLTAAGAITLVAGVDYKLNADHGSIEFLGTFTGVTADYDHAVSAEVGAFTEVPQDITLRFEGINLATKKKVLVEVFKVALNPISEFSLIGDDFAGLTLEGDILVDTSRAEEGEGQYFRIVNID